jgi:hypothetical protein
MDNVCSEEKICEIVRKFYKYCKGGGSSSSIEKLMTDICMKIGDIRSGCNLSPSELFRNVVDDDINKYIKKYYLPSESKLEFYRLTSYTLRQIKKDRKDKLSEWINKQYSFELEPHEIVEWYSARVMIIEIHPSLNETIEVMKNKKIEYIQAIKYTNESMEKGGNVYVHIVEKDSEQITNENNKPYYEIINSIKVLWKYGFTVNEVMNALNLTRHTAKLLGIEDIP